MPKSESRAEVVPLLLINLYLYTKKIVNAQLPKASRLLKIGSEHNGLFKDLSNGWERVSYKYYRKYMIE